MKYGEEAVYELLEALNQHAVPYMLVGSFSSNAYGEARSTKDADFVVQFSPLTRAAVLDALGGEFIIDDQITFETITRHTRQILKVPSIPFEIELFDLSDEPFDQSRFERKIKTSIGGHEVWLPTAEDVIVQKCGGRLSGTVEKIISMPWVWQRFDGINSIGITLTSGVRRSASGPD